MSYKFLAEMQSIEIHSELDPEKANHGVALPLLKLGFRIVGMHRVRLSVVPFLRRLQQLPLVARLVNAEHFEEINAGRERAHQKIQFVLVSDDGGTVAYFDAASAGSCVFHSCTSLGLHVLTLPQSDRTLPRLARNLRVNTVQGSIETLFEEHRVRLDALILGGTPPLCVRTVDHALLVRKHLWTQLADAVVRLGRAATLAANFTATLLSVGFGRVLVERDSASFGGVVLLVGAILGGMLAAEMVGTRGVQSTLFVVLGGIGAAATASAALGSLVVVPIVFFASLGVWLTVPVWGLIFMRIAPPSILDRFLVLEPPSLAGG